MQKLNALYKAENKHQTFLGFLFIIYILSSLEVPEKLSIAINTTGGNSVVMLLALSVFYHTHSVIGILGLIAAYELIKRSGNGVAYIDIDNYIPSESGKSRNLDIMQPTFKGSLEEDMVRNMVPLVVPGQQSDLNYQPTLDSLHNASPLDYQGVI
jgi:hypothetical protein